MNRLFLIALCYLILGTACKTRHRKANTNTAGLAKEINYTAYRAVKNFNPRVYFLVMHYTACNFEKSVRTLTQGPVSAHYLVPDITDSTFVAAGYKQQEIFSLVDESHRSWHAGVSSWGNRANINDTSIGIEIVNTACEKDGIFTFPDFHPEQVNAVKKLAKYILMRYPDIKPTHVLGHSDIAPTRKSDPGPRFPWYTLYQEGIGAWFDQNVKNSYVTIYTSKGMPPQEMLLNMFAKYGYNTSFASTPDGYQNLVRAFQLHFYPEKYDGLMDVETAARLSALIDKYFPPKV